MSSLDTSDHDQEPQGVAHAVPKRTSGDAPFAQSFSAETAAATDADNNVHGLLRAFADTQQFLLTGPSFAPMQLAQPLDRLLQVNQILSSITGCCDLSEVVRATIGDVTAWSLPSRSLPGIYSGVVYVAPSKAHTAMMSISLHRFSAGDPALLTAQASPLPASPANPLSQVPGFPVSFTFVSAFSLVAQRVNRAHSVLPHATSAEAAVGLSDSEREVLAKCSQGLSAAETARQLGVAESAVQSHLQSALRLLSCGSRPLGVLKAARLGLIPCSQ